AQALSRVPLARWRFARGPRPVHDTRGGLCRNRAPARETPPRCLHGARHAVMVGPPAGMAGRTVRDPPGLGFTAGGWGCGRGGRDPRCTTSRRPAQPIASEPMIRFEDVTKRYADGTVAVDGLSLEVPRGGITVLVGPSGCGKTTSLRMINRMVEPTSGRILLEGEDISQRPAAQLRRHIGYVIQHAGLFPHRTV